MLKSILIAATLAVLGSAASAQTDWSGAYGGANITWGDTQFDAKGVAADDLADLGFGKALGTADDPTLALRGGYDWQAGNLVWGAGAEVNLGLSDVGFSSGVNAMNSAAGVTETLEVGREKSVFGRLGYASGDFLAYGLAGWTWAEAKGTTNDGTTAEAYNFDMDGLKLGLGAEYRVSPAISVYGEYSVTKFDNIDGGADQVLDIESEKLAVGLNYRF